MLLLEQLQDTTESINTWKGIAIVLGSLGGFKYVWDYLKRKSDNDAKVKISNNDKDNISKMELTRQYDELLDRFDELEKKFEHTERQLDKALTAFDIILPLIQEVIETNPRYKAVVDKALQHLTKQ